MDAAEMGMSAAGIRTILWVRDRDGDELLSPSHSRFCSTIITQLYGGKKSVVSVPLEAMWQKSKSPNSVYQMWCLWCT